MSTNYRALCAELVAAFNSYHLFTDAETTTAWQRAERVNQVIAAAVAALKAEPETSAEAPAIRIALERLLARLDETTDMDGPVPAWIDSYCTAVQALKAEPEGKGPSLDEVDELCAEFGFCLPDDEGRVCSKEVLLDVITAAITRWGTPTTPPAPPAFLRRAGPRRSTNSISSDQLIQ